MDETLCYPSLIMISLESCQGILKKMTISNNWDIVFCFTKETNFVSIDTNVCLYRPWVQFAHRNNISTKVVNRPILHSTQLKWEQFSTKLNLMINERPWNSGYIYTFFSEYGINDHRCNVLIKSKFSYYSHPILLVCSTMYVVQ